MVCAGLVLTFFANHWFMYAQNNIQDEGPSIVEIFKSSGNIPKENEQERVSSLEFALIINPPAPPEVKKAEPQHRQNKCPSFI